MASRLNEPRWPSRVEPESFSTSLMKDGSLVLIFAVRPLYMCRPFTDLDPEPRLCMVGQPQFGAVQMQ